MSKEIKFLTGTTEQCDAYIGPAGTWVIDVERMEIRLHDGFTQGGHRIPNIFTVQQLKEDPNNQSV